MTRAVTAVILHSAAAADRLHLFGQDVFDPHDRIQRQGTKFVRSIVEQNQSVAVGELFLIERHLQPPVRELGRGGNRVQVRLGRQAGNVQDQRHRTVAQNGGSGILLLAPSGGTPKA